MEILEDSQRLLEEQPLEERKSKRNLSLIVFSIIALSAGMFALLQMFVLNDGQAEILNSHKLGSISNHQNVTGAIPATSPLSTSTMRDENDVHNTPPRKSTKLNLPAQEIRAMSGRGSLSKSFNWVKVKGQKDGYYVEEEGDAYILKHIEEASAVPIAYKSDFKLNDGSHLTFDDWQISPDLKSILLTANREDGWRHSFFADYWVFDVESKSLNTLNSTITDKYIPHEKGSGKTSLIIWGPNSNSVAWVRDNDLYATVNGKEFRITTDGSKDIINGISDWVYEEEVFAGQQATWFSLNSNCLAFVKFNESLVTDYELQYYAKYGENAYPTIIDVKYPKPGTYNPTVGFYISNLNSTDQTPVLINFGEDGFAENDVLITQVTWVSQDDAVLVRLMNRVQDSQKLFLVTSSGSGLNEWTAKLVRQESTSDGAWYNRLQPLHFLDPSESSSSRAPAYIELMDSPDGYQHLAFFSSVNDPSPSHWITSGKWEVVDIKGIDNKEELIYYTSTEIGTSQRHIFSIKFDGSGKKLLAPSNSYEKVVPQVAGSLGSEDFAGFYDAQFSKGCKYYVLAYLGPDIPWVKIEKSGNYMDAKMILPANFDPSKKYPVLMQVYGGPGSQMTSMVLDLDFMHKITSQNIISLLVDGRGTGYHGRAYRSAVSKHLGGVEIEDQIFAAKWLSKQTYVDDSKIGIWGWSFGGFLTCKAIEANSGVFNLGMAVAPVTDWRFYDSVYTERFMKTPQTNPGGYRVSAVTNMEGFKHAKFLMIHGTADDNVHFQNSADLVWHLTGAGVDDYTTQYYTDSDHSIYTNGANPAVFHKLERFMCKNWELKCVPL